MTITDEARAARLDALRAPLTDDAAIAAFAHDIDDRISALYFALAARCPEHAARLQHRLGDLRAAAANATRACGVVADEVTP
jgi:hypothetical protein